MEQFKGTTTSETVMKFEFYFNSVNKMEKKINSEHTYEDRT